LTVPDNVDQGVTETGHPWIGAAEPVLEIVEFADYQCFQCWKMHQYLRHSVAAHPDKIRLVHVHYPMDHEVNPIVDEPFHGGAGVMAAMAIYAQEKEKFWEMNDYLYFHWRNDRELTSMAAAAALDLHPGELGGAHLNPRIKERLLKLNIRYGMKLRVMGTPSFLINGRLYQGTFPFELIDNLAKE
jgi:protein-disulfide isomerase